MTLPTIRVVGLGPAGEEHITARTLSLLRSAPVVRLRTRVHPAAQEFGDVESYDEWYERADSFDELYQAIADDLVALATGSPNGEVVYAVPGSPVVAERTVELVRAHSAVRTICEPAVSVLDMVCAALGRDPMRGGLRVIDALDSSEPLRGPGPLLVLQTYAPEVLAMVGDRLEAGTAVTVLHHVGLSDQVITTMTASSLGSFGAADHLTSLWIDQLRTAGEATDDLVAVARRLRRECPWDQEQTHASLTRHLLEEAYEALDALESFVRVDTVGEVARDGAQHVQEELGDLLFHIVFHAELADEEGYFNMAAVIDGVREKLIGRHPHVFGDVHVESAHDVAERWEVLKRAEKGRDSVIDGIAWQLPALALYAKLLGRGARVNGVAVNGSDARDRARRALGSLTFDGAHAEDETRTQEIDAQWGDALEGLVAAAQWSGVDLEGVLRERARALGDEIRLTELRAND